MEREIKITGKGKIMVKPDVQIVKFTYEETKRTYNEAMQLLSTKNDEIMKKFEKLGYVNQELKMNNFSIDKKTEQYEEKSFNKKYVKYKTVGYTLKLKYEIRTEINGKLLSEIISCINEINKYEESDAYSQSLIIEYDLKNITKNKNDALVLAVNDCKEKAKVLADSADVRIINTKTIEYWWNSIRMVHSDGCCGGYGGMLIEELSINPKDIEVEAEVTMTFEIGDKKCDERHMISKDINIEL